MGNNSSGDEDQEGGDCGDGLDDGGAANEKNNDDYEELAAAKVQTAACHALWKLSFNSPGNRVDNFKLVSGACGAIGNISQNQPINSYIVDAARGIDISVGHIGLGS
ncbi:MAG: hypothetical protein ACREOZ_03655 [Gloeomargaritales cyanobacterium]